MKLKILRSRTKMPFCRWLAWGEIPLLTFLYNYFELLHNYFISLHGYCGKIGMKKIIIIFLISLIAYSCKKTDDVAQPNTPQQTDTTRKNSNPDSILITYKFISVKIPQVRSYAVTKNNEQIIITDTVYSNNTEISTYTYKGAPYAAELFVNNDTVTVQKFVNNNLFCQNKHWQIAEVQCYY
jgi:hypothetical protein